MNRRCHFQLWARRKWQPIKEFPQSNCTAVNSFNSPVSLCSLHSAEVNVNKQDKRYVQIHGSRMVAVAVAVAPEASECNGKKRNQLSIALLPYRSMQRFSSLTCYRCLFCTRSGNVCFMSNTVTSDPGIMVHVTKGAWPPWTPLRGGTLGHTFTFTFRAFSRRFYPKRLTILTLSTFVIMWFLNSAQFKQMMSLGGCGGVVHSCGLCRHTVPVHTAMFICTGLAFWYKYLVLQFNACCC